MYHSIGALSNLLHQLVFLVEELGVLEKVDASVVLMIYALCITGVDLGVIFIVLAHFFLDFGLISAKDWEIF
jgi:hypothetical protein